MNIYDTLELFKELCHNTTEVNISSLINTIHNSFYDGYPETSFHCWYYSNGLNNEYPYPEVMIKVELIYNATIYIHVANMYTIRYNQTIDNKDNVIITEIDYHNGKGDSWTICYNQDLRLYKKEETNLKDLAEKIDAKFKYGSY